MAQSETLDKHVNVRFPSDIHAAMVAIASEEHRPVGAWVRHEIIKIVSARTANPSAGPQRKSLERVTVEPNPKGKR